MLAVVLLALPLAPFHETIHRAIPALLLLVPVLVTGAVGGRLAALGVAVAAIVAFASLFLPPAGIPVATLDDFEVFGLFALVSISTGLLTASTVDAERRRAGSERARRQALEQLDAQRRAMLRAVSHDLRTPLASIHAAATGLRSGTPYDTATRQELLDVIVAQTERLDRLVANVLSLGRIEAGALDPERDTIDLEELVEACARRLTGVLASLDLTVVRHGGPAEVDADYSQIDQVVTNLLENAAAHSRPGERIEVALAVTGGTVSLAVIDHGTGLAPEIRDHVFDPYTSTSAGATRGIGLTICRSIVDAHGGTIDARDTPGGGATFEVRLPRRRP